MTIDKHTTSRKLKAYISQVNYGLSSKQIPEKSLNSGEIKHL
jgi:hypothetical protein